MSQEKILLNAILLFSSIAVALPLQSQTVQYSYDSQNRLSTVTNPDGTFQTYLYENADFPNVITGLVDEKGVRISTWSYDDKGRATNTFEVGGVGNTTLTYANNSVTVTDALGAVRTFSFGRYGDWNKVSGISGSQCPTCVEKKLTTYDVKGYLTSRTNYNGVVNNFSYDDDRGLELSRTEAAGTSQAVTTVTAWHSTYNLPLSISLYSGNSAIGTPLKITSFTYDVSGNELTKTILDPSNNLSRTFSYTYNATGEILTEDGPRTLVNDVTTYTYDISGHRATMTNALGYVIHYNNYDSAGRLLSVTDSNGITTEFTYHDRGWLLTSTLKHPNNAALNAITSYGYDAVGLMTSMTLPNGVRLDYEYDGARRLVAIKNANNERIEYQLDAAGNRTGETIKDSSGAITYSVARAFDELSRVMNVTGNHQQQDSFKYDVNDNQTEASDALTHKTQQNFDALNRVAKVIDPNLGETKFTYDGQSRIQTVTDARGNVTTYNYDGLGNLLSQTSPDTGTSTFSYDAAGNRTSAKDARGVVVNYAYDALNRLTHVTYPTSSENINYTYDDNSNGNYGVGRLTGISSSSAAINYQYNYQGLITKKSVTIGGVLSSTFYAYDLAGNLASTQYPSGRIVTYVRDTLGRVQAIKTKADANATEQTVVSGISYLPFGPAKQYTYGNGLSHTVTYDNDYRISAITVGGVLSRGYSYDVADNITGISDGVASTKSQTFTYDSLDRLESANGSYGYQIFSYDAVGNRTGLLFDTGSSVLSDTYNYETTSNRLSSITKKINNLSSPSRNFTYDNAGNLINDSTLSAQTSGFAFNDANRLSGLTLKSALAASYTYNPLGQRVVKTLVNNSKEIYHYDEAGQLIAVTNAAGVMQREYIYNGNQLVGFINNQVVISPILLSAASATFQGSHTLSKAQTGYTGSTGFIDIVGEGQVNWALNIVTTSNYDIKVRYSLAAANRPLDVLVDGVKKGTLNFPATANWNTWATATINLSLTAGNHTFSLKTTGTSGANIDKVDVVPSAVIIAGPTLHYVHTDHLGTPQVVTAQNQSVIWMVDYQPFGQLKPNQSNSIELYSRFPGQYLDTESGLYYNYFRDYDPSIGRYIESDPIGLNGGINTYAYVGGNPIRKTDPTGLIFVDPWGTIPDDTSGSQPRGPTPEDNCGCFEKNFLGYDEAGLAAAEAATGPYVPKPRGGIAGGGPAGNMTSAFSSMIHSVNKQYGKSAATTLLRNTGRAASRLIPYAGTAMFILDIQGYEKCMQECKDDKCQKPQ